MAVANLLPSSKTKKVARDCTLGGLGSLEIVGLRLEGYGSRYNSILTTLEI